MLRHWGRPFYNKPQNLPTSNDTTPLDIAFPYNHTEYITSGRKAEYETIWMKALNLSISEQQNRSHSANEFMMKSRMLADMVDTPVHPHSFATVMAIASLFLFFTLGITITLVMFCRKKNIVFALQKSEQEDEIDYEMDDMEFETNTDIEYGSDDENESRDQLYSHVLAANTDSPSRKPLMPIYASHDAHLTAVTPIYRPKKPLHGADSKGAYHAVQGATKTEISDGYDTMSDTSLTESPLVRRHSRPLAYNVATTLSRNTAALFLAKSAIQSAQEGQKALTNVSLSQECINIEMDGEATINGSQCDTVNNSATLSRSRSSDVYFEETETEKATRYDACMTLPVSPTSGRNSKHNRNAKRESDIGVNKCITLQTMRYSAHEEAIVHSSSKSDSKNQPDAKCSCKALVDQSYQIAASYRQLGNQNSTTSNILRNNTNYANPYKYNPNNPFLNDICCNAFADEPSKMCFRNSNQATDTVTKSSNFVYPLAHDNSVSLSRNCEITPTDQTNSNKSSSLPQTRDHWVTFEQK